MSSRRLLIEPGGARCEGSLPTRATGGRAACPCKVGELEGSECASSDMVAWWVWDSWMVTTREMDVVA